MIEIDLASENDLWKLFRTTTLPEDGHLVPGERAHEFHYIWDVLYDRKLKKRPAFSLKDDDRFYCLRSRSGQALVPQSALLKVGRVMYARDQNLMVQYVGRGSKRRVNGGASSERVSKGQPVSPTKTGGSKARRIDSVDKIVEKYLASVCAEPFEYKGKEYRPKPLRVSPGIFRGFTCPAMCGGCCPRFSLDYLPTEAKPEGVELMERFVKVDGRKVRLLSDLQDDHNNHYCRNLNMKNGRCNIHGRQPFSCDFELIRFMQTKDDNQPNMLNQKLYGRGWAMLRVDGDRGALCEMTPADEHTKEEVVRKLRRLQEWAGHFGVRTKLEGIIQWVEDGPHDEPLFV